VGNPAWMPG